MSELKFEPRKYEDLGHHETKSLDDLDVLLLRLANYVQVGGSKRANSTHYYYLTTGARKEIEDFIAGRRPQPAITKEEYNALGTICPICGDLCLPHKNNT